jgi:hypothetical protein
MTHPWGDPAEIEIAYKFTRELIKSTDAIEAIFHCTIPDLVSNEVGRRGLFNEVYERAKAYELDGYSPAVDTIYILSTFMEAAGCDKSHMKLFFSEGIYNAL